MPYTYRAEGDRFTAQRDDYEPRRMYHSEEVNLAVDLFTWMAIYGFTHLERK